jgi:hypothetical protein
MLGYQTINDRSTGGERRYRAVLVRKHQPAVFGDIGGEDRREATGDGHSSGTPALRKPAK